MLNNTLMRISFSSISSRINSALRALFVVHYRFTLSLFFAAAAAAGGMLFWQYASRFAEPPEVTVRTIKIKNEDTREILSHIKTRGEIREILRNKTFPNPFTEPPKKQ